MVDAVTWTGRDAGGHGEGHGQQSEGQGEVGREVSGAEVAAEAEQAMAGQTGQQEGHACGGVGADGELGGNHVERACRDHQGITSFGKGRIFGCSVGGATLRCNDMKATMVTNRMAKACT